MAVTIYDVAKKAGVSTATVSKVLSNTPYVSEKTREKVLAIVAEMDYVPNLAARSLGRARTHIIGLAFPYASDYLINDPHLMAFMFGVQQEAAEHEYNTLLAAAHQGDDVAGGLRRLLRTQYVDGAIVVGTRSVQRVFQEIRHRAYPVVSLGYYSPWERRNTIHADDRRGGELAAEHLIALGHRRIGLISGPAEIIAVSERVQGFQSALAEAGLPLDPALSATGDFSSESGQAAARLLLAREDRPSAIFAVNDRMALGCIAAAQQLGYAVPADLSVVGFDDVPAAAFSTPSLTTIQQPSLEMGRLSAQQVFRMLDEKLDGFEPIVLPVALIERNSTNWRPGSRIVSR